MPALPIDATENTARAVRSAVAKHNGDLRRDGWIAIGMGIGTLAFMYLIVFLLTVTVRFYFFFKTGLLGTFLFATGIFAVFAAAGWWSARRGDDPQGPDLSDSADVGLRALNYAATGNSFNPAYLAGGPAHLLVHGPRTIRLGYDRLHGLVRSDQQTLAAAAALLARLCKGSVPLGAIESKPAAIVLLQTGLAKFEKAGGTTIVATMKGRETVAK